MAYANDLLELSRSLADADPSGSSQAALRRAVSTAYYALFHLLISEATGNWQREELRPELGRLFDHGRMRGASTEIQSEMARRAAQAIKGTHEHAVYEGLRLVAITFLGAQQARNQADYNTAKIWTWTDALLEIDRVAEAFERWEAVSHEPLAQAYLLSLLGKRA